MGFFALRKSTETQARGRISGEIRVPAGYTARAYYCWFINIATSQMHTFSPALLLMNIDVVNHRSRYYHHHHHSNITGCAVAQHCYNGDVSFLWEKMDILTPCKIETLEQIDTQFVRIDYFHERNVCSKFGKNPFTEDFWVKGWNITFLCDFFIYKCKKTVVYLQLITAKWHIENSKNNERWYYFRSTSPV